MVRFVIIGLNKMNTLLAHTHTHTMHVNMLNFGAILTGLWLHTAPTTFPLTKCTHYYLCPWLHILPVESLMHNTCMVWILYTS